MIRSYRCAPANDKVSSDVRIVAKQKEALESAMALPLYDADTMLFVLDGILSLPQEWAKVETLKIEPGWRHVPGLLRAISAFLHLHCVLPVSILKKGLLTRAAVEQILGTDGTNSFAIRDEHGTDMETDLPPGLTLGYGMWADASFFNHSCAYNIHRKRDGRKWIFKTFRDVRKGEELCITYSRNFEVDGSTVRERREFLRTSWGFECQCLKCISEAEQTAA